MVIEDDRPFLPISIRPYDDQDYVRYAVSNFSTQNSRATYPVIEVLEKTI